MKTLIRTKTLFGLSVAAAVLMCCSNGQASITGWSNWGNDSGLLNCTSWLDTSPRLTIQAAQDTSGPASAWGTIHTDTANDPTLTINDQINNASGIDWSAFTLDIFMSSTFTIGPSSPSVANPSGWTEVVTQPIFTGTSWMGEIKFTGGTPVSANPSSANNLFNFTYQITFAGSLSYNFSEQGSATPVPEPASVTFILLGMGALVCSWRMKRSENI